MKREMPEKVIELHGRDFVGSGDVCLSPVIGKKLQYGIRYGFTPLVCVVINQAKSLETLPVSQLPEKWHVVLVSSKLTFITTTLHGFVDS